MTRSPLANSLGPEFDPFLFASVGADRNGMPLSVLSALARLDVDPWHEAARLTALSTAAATHSLAALLAARPDEATGGGGAAARLIALLPQRTNVNSQLSRGLPGAGMTIESRVQLPVILLLIFMACMLAVEALTATHGPPAQIGQASAPASSTIMPKLPPPGGGT